MSTVAGLPKFVVLKSKSDGKYLHYLWNDPSFGPYVNDLGCKRNLDPVDPFVKFEVVPSSSNPTQLVHLRFSHNNKFLELNSKYGVSWVSATANGTDESTTRTTSTLFRPIFPAGEPNTVGFLHVQKNCHVRTFQNAGYSADINGVACVYTNDGNGMHRFEFAAWESYDEKIRKVTRESTGQVTTAKDREIQQLRASNVASVNAKDGEIRNLKSAYEEKMKAKDREITSHVEKMKVKEGEITKKVEASYVEKMKAKDDEIKKLGTSYAEKMKVKEEEIIKKVEASYLEKMKAKDDEMKKVEASYVEKMKIKDGEIKKVEASYVEKIKAKDDDMKKVEASHMEKMKGKDDEMKKVEADYVEKMKAKEDEMKKVEASYVEKIKAKDEEIKELISKAKDGDGGDGGCQQADDIIAELRLEIAELKVLLADACRENDDLKEAAGN